MCTAYCCVYINTYMTDDIVVECQDCPYWLNLGESNNDSGRNDQEIIAAK